jgi:hypothetical protein
MKLNRLVVVGLGIALLLIAALATQRSLDAQDKKGGDAGGAEYSYGRKVLLVYEHADSSASGFVVGDAVLTRMGGRSVLVGKDVAQQSWTLGHKITLAWDKIAAIIEFDDIKTYEKRLATAAADTKKAE